MHTVNDFAAVSAPRFDVFQLVRLLHAMQPDGGPRFAADLGAGFPGHEVKALDTDPHSGAPRLHTANFCLAGTLGPLPEPYTEWLRAQARRSDSPAAAFLGIFDQRLHVLRHDLKARQLPELQCVAPDQGEHALRLAALMGLHGKALQDQVDLPPRAWLALAAVLGNVRRSAHVLGRVLALLLGARVGIEQFVGAWRPIDARDQTRLGRANQRLGQGAVLGRKVWDQQARVRLSIHDLDYARACTLLPPARGQDPSPAHAHLCALVRMLLDREYDCEVRVGCRRATVPPARLDARPGASPAHARRAGLRLGQTAWLGRAPAAPFARFLIRAEPCAGQEVAA